MVYSICVCRFLNTPPPYWEIILFDNLDMVCYSIIVRGLGMMCRGLGRLLTLPHDSNPIRSMGLINPKRMRGIDKSHIYILQNGGMWGIGYVGMIMQGK
jgi:hypothetical protein